MIAITGEKFLNPNLHIVNLCLLVKISVITTIIIVNNEIKFNRLK
jgi:hypothetical protein